MSSAIHQLSCFSSINRYPHLQKRPVSAVALRSKLSVVMSLEGRGTETSSSEIKTTLSYVADTSKLPIDGTAKSYQSIKNDADQMGMTEPVQEYGVTQQKGAAKIHDFCFGIPYGVLVLSSSFIGFIFSKNPTALSTGMLFGGALLALSTFSLKIWRQGKSSLPFILGQAAIMERIPSIWPHPVWHTPWRNYQVISGHLGWVRSIAFDPSNTWFYTGSADCTIKKTIINAMAVNEGVMATAGDDGSLWFWDWKSGHNFQRAQTIVQPGSLDSEAGIYAPSYDITGSRLVTGEADKTIKMWKEDENAAPETHPLNFKPPKDIKPF